MWFKVIDFYTETGFDIFSPLHISNVCHPKIRICASEQTVQAHWSQNILRETAQLDTLTISRQQWLRMKYAKKWGLG